MGIELLSSKKLNICLVIGGHYPPYPHGGVGSFAVDLAEGVVKRGHKITCISFYSKQILHSDKIVTEVINGVKVVRVPKPFEDLHPRIRAVMEKLYIARLIRGLHQQDPFSLVEGEDGGGRLGLGRLPDIPKVIRLHATTIYNDYELQRKPSRLNHFFEYLWIRRADAIAAVSDHVGKTTLKLTCLNNRKKYEVIYPSVDIAYFKSDPSIAIEPGLIVFTGVVAPRKGVKELIQAMNLVFTQNKQAHLRIIGDDKYIYQGEPFTSVIMTALKEEFKDRVESVGPVLRNRLPQELGKAELCCFPSHVETFGIGIVEAMAMQKPVIFMKNSPGPEVIEDGVSGLLCDTWNPVEIAEKILYLLARPVQAQAMGKQARQRVLQKFEKETWVERNIKFYEECIEKFRSRKQGIK